MLDRLLPRPIDNTYAGPRLALGLLGFLVLSKGFMGLNCIFNGRFVATTADGIPLDAYDPAGAGAVVSFFALWGLSQVTLSLLGTLTLFRYRSAVPAMFALFTFEHLSRKAILWMLPVEKVGSPSGTYVNLGLLAVMIVGLGISLRRARR
jgi:hypothetical protein